MNTVDIVLTLSNICRTRKHHFGGLCHKDEQEDSSSREHLVVAVNNAFCFTPLKNQTS